jgi:hypothetical protein
MRTLGIAALLVGGAFAGAQFLEPVTFGQDREIAFDGPDDVAVDIVSYEQESYRAQEFAALFSSEGGAVLRSLSLLLRNNTGEDIMALSVVWAPENGSPRVVMSSGFDLPSWRSIIRASDEGILMPTGFHTRRAISGATMRSVVDSTRIVNEPQFVSGDVRISVDTVVFRNGLVIGEENTGLVEMIEEQHEAAGRIAQIAREAWATGQDLNQILRDLRPAPRVPPVGPVDRNMLAEYAERLLRTPDARRETVLLSFEAQALLPLPTFFRR